MGVQVPRRVHAEVPLIDPAEIFGGGGDRVSEGEKLDLDRAECGTQAAQFS